MIDKNANVEDLFKLLNSSRTDFLNPEVDYSKLKYAIYARKSTIGDERQEHSISDQIDLCLKHCVEQEGLNVVEIISEKGSAKEPDIRPKFTSLIEKLKNGKLDAIISYHPDRLSRNMKEAGELIDLLDKGVLMDLRFATSSFENSPTGKMLLGISFVLSKQYSENLSQVVTRGNVRATEQRGEFIGKRVHGYRVLKNRALEPDGNNYQIVRSMFQRRLDGERQIDIAKWANSKGYKVQYSGKKATEYTWTKGRVSTFFKDPVYAGVLKYGKSLVVLRDHYDFVPAVSVDDFLKINKVSDLTSATISSRFLSKNSAGIRADLLRGVVECAHCGKRMSTGITSKKKKDGKTDYFYFRCNTEYCDYRGKSMRAKVIVNYCIEFLKENLFTTKANYENYKIEAREALSEKRREINSNIGSLSKSISDKKQEYSRAKNLLLNNDGFKEHFNLDEIQTEINELTKQLKSKQKDLSSLKDSIVTYDKYLELFENIGKIIEVGVQNSINIKALDSILQKFFSNLTVEASENKVLQWSIKEHKLKEPWNGFLNEEKVLLVGVKGLKPSTSRSQTERAINCATPRS